MVWWHKAAGETQTWKSKPGKKKVTMLVLFETAAGHALFKVQDESKLANADDISKYFETADKASQVLVWNPFFFLSHLVRFGELIFIVCVRCH